ncbi:MAG TPA: CobW family GTP-binding protein [Nitrospiraceae bacterium]|nr:CobW family GTP-binding protein [Nitrospiraceae bacterium]
MMLPIRSLPVPFYILCGSLGAGKTTLLMRLLEFWNRRNERVGVLMNEAGEISIDGPRVGVIAEQVLNLAGGCVCCDTKEDLSWGIAQLIQDYHSTLIVLECSGMADPAEVVDAVTDVYVRRLVRLERIIALVQPASLPETGLAEVATRHAIRFADDLILNKRDLYIPGHWESFRSGLSATNPYARIWETTHARVDVDHLLDAERHNINIAGAGHGTVAAAAKTQLAERAGHHPMVTTVRIEKPLQRAQFLEWINTLPEGLERAKGFFRFVDEPELQEFQFSAPRTGTVASVMLLDEPEHAIVLIGRGYDPQSLKATLLRCLS